MSRYKVTWSIRKSGEEIASGIWESDFPEGTDATGALKTWEAAARVSFPQTKPKSIEYIGTVTQV